MYPFKSRKTFERLYHNQPNTPNLDYDSRPQIDRRFSEFCHEFAKRELSIGPMTELNNEAKKKPKESKKKKNVKSNSQILKKKVHFDEDENQQGENTDEERLWGLLEEKIKENLKKKDKENPLVKYFKNPLIAAVIESLIVKTVESTFKIKLDLDNHDELVPSNLVKLFGISPIALSTMGSKQEKLNYVIQCMAKNIDESLDRLMQRVDYQDKKITEFESKFEEVKNNDLNDQKDIFEWLNIKTKYQHLQKRLRISIIEKLNHFENQQIMRSSLRTKNSGEKLALNSERKDQSKNFLNKIALYKVPHLSTETILKDMNSEFTLITRRAHYNKHKSSSNDKQVDYISPVTLDPLPDVYDWDLTKEDLFKNNRKSAKNLYNEEIKCSNFLSVAFLPLVQESYLNEKRALHRNKKLMKYADGEWLTADELKFLADTSTLLNKCVDRNFLQNAVNIIDPEMVENLELLLAENIIMNYENLRDTIKNARLEYIKKINSWKLENIQEKAAELMKKEEIQKRIQDNRKFKKTLENICLKMERQGKFYRKPKEQKEVFASLFIQKLKNTISRKKSLEAKHQAEQNGFARLAQTTSCSSRKLDIKRRKYHPASKLFMQDKVPEIETDEEILIAGLNKEKTNKKEINKFSLNLHSPVYSRSAQNFTKFYSGGPIPPIRTEPFWSPYDPKKPIICNSASEMRKIITLQKYIRKFLAKVRVQNIKEEPRKLVSETIRRINKNGKNAASRFFETVQTVTKKAPKPKGFRSLRSINFTKTLIKNNPTDNNINNNNNANNDQSHPGSGLFKKIISPIYPLPSPSNNIPTPSPDLNEYFTSSVTPKPRMQFGGFFSNGISTPVTTQPTENHNLKFYAAKVENSSPGGPNQSQKQFHPKVSSFVSSVTKSNKNMSTQMSLGSQDLHKKNPSEPGQIGGLLKHRKLMENAKTGTLSNLRCLGFSFSKGDVDFKDENNNTALFYAAERGMFDFCDFLLRLGANPNQRCSERNTPVHMAFQGGKMDVITTMLKHGGDMDLKNKQGESPRKLGNGRVLKELDLKMMVSFLT